MSEIGRDQYLAHRAQLFVRREPAQAMRLAVAKVLRTWSPRPLSSDFSRPRLVAIALVYAIPLDLLVVAGLLIGPMRQPVKLFLLLPAVYLTFAAAFSVGSLRYRIPADVPMAVLAAGVVQWFIRWRQVNQEDQAAKQEMLEPIDEIDQPLGQDAQTAPKA